MSPHPVAQSSYGTLLGRKRTVNFDLPPRLQRKGASYYYVCKDRKWLPLGKNLTRAKHEWARLECAVSPLSVGELLDRYVSSADLAESSRKQYKSYQKALAKDLTVPALDLRAVHVALWRDRPENRERKQYVNGCLALLNSAWQKGREWGLVEADVKVGKNPSPPSDRYLTDKDFRAIRDKAPEWLKVAMDLAYLTAARPVDVRSLKWDKVGELVGVRQIKTGQRQEFTISPELADVLARAKARPILGLYVIATDKGRPISRDRMGRAWIAARKAAGVDAQFREIRAKAATDAKKGGQDFQALLGHSSRKMSERYIRLRETVIADPVRRKL